MELDYGWFLFELHMFFERLSGIEAARRELRNEPTSTKEAALRKLCQEVDIPYHPDLPNIIANNVISWRSEVGVVMAYLTVWEKYLQARPYDPLGRTIDGMPLGLCLDISRGAADLTRAQQRFVDYVRAGIGGYDGIVAAAELECILRKTFTAFSLTPRHLIAFIRARAKERKIALPV
ncbi:hypothetical protein A2851_04785 [Candidatus Kaiserbacteria bacterium RIFCSPHIGHO2_01_FULL_53_29]|uniref:Uncharacterized protein n=1 Tax=Candidatus Kaiserbacteria bacterium RIFCSPHIGHO2_01_FULL_53_29 TaxID=1798480 RepID=A0A1F6CTJ8_9BACT|nr:MAG: hypothetical protein A2851_04785 [Candidatus Kaiserbacteria bacterium RIFCSPHIGHO2_01_FULL_53_29]